MDKRFEPVKEGVDRVAGEWFGVEKGD